MSELRLIPILISFCGIYVFKSSPAQAHSFKTQASIQTFKDGGKSDSTTPIAPQSVEFQESFQFLPSVFEPEYFAGNFAKPLAISYLIRAGLSPPSRAFIA